MLFRLFCARRRGSLPAGLLLMAIGLVHQALAPLWARHFHLSGHARSLSVDFVSGLALGIGSMLMVNSFSNQQRSESSEYASHESESEND